MSGDDTVSIIKTESTLAPLTAHNFAVADFETYFVGESKVWVHNTCLSSALKKKLKRISNQTAADGNRAVSGVVSNDDAMRLGREFVGDGYRMMSNGKGYVSADGLRTFRFPEKKNGIEPNTGTPWSSTGRQANFETKSDPNDSPISNVHLDVQ